MCCPTDPPACSHENWQETLGLSRVLQLYNLEPLACCVVLQTLDCHNTDRLSGKFYLVNTLSIEPTIIPSFILCFDSWWNIQYWRTFDSLRLNFRLKYERLSTGKVYIIMCREATDIAGFYLMEIVTCVSSQVINDSFAPNYCLRLRATGCPVRRWHSNFAWLWP